MNHHELPPPAQLMAFIVGKWISKPIYAVAELGIADMLAEGPKTIEELARLSRTDPSTLYRVMRALAGVGIFSESTGRRFELTPMAGYLKSGALRSAALLFNSSWNDQAWEHFPYTVKTGNTGFGKAHGMPLSTWLGHHPGEAQIFNDANAVKAAMSHSAIVDAYDFSGISTLIDVGGGTGALIADILDAWPAMKGVVADLPSVVKDAEKVIRKRGLDDRCKVQACDFFSEIPSCGDAWLMSHILHDWPDDQCRRILTNCRQAMSSESRLLIVEMIIPPGNTPSIARLLDMEMLVITGGRERTEAEYRGVLEEAGFTCSQVIPTPRDVSIMEAHPG